MLRAGWARGRSAGADPAFTLAWVHAAAALVQGTGGEQPFQHTFDVVGMLEDTARRFPGHSELSLSRALILSRLVHVNAAEGWFSSGGRQYLARLGRTGDPWPADNLADAIKRFLPLQGDPAVRTEATLQLGYLKGLEGRSQEAVRLLTRLETLTTDPWLLFLGRFFQGQILTSLRQYSDAGRSLERALEIYPHADSARRALAALRYVDGDRAAAIRLLDNPPGQATGVDADPWPWFAYGEYRQWPARLARVRSLLP